jgi:hypothetical protein
MLQRGTQSLRAHHCGLISAGRDQMAALAGPDTTVPALLFDPPIALDLRPFA